MRKKAPRQNITQTVRTQPEISKFFCRKDREQKHDARVDKGPRKINSNNCKNITCIEREIVRVAGREPLSI